MITIYCILCRNIFEHHDVDTSISTKWVTHKSCVIPSSSQWLYTDVSQKRKLFFENTHFFISNARQKKQGNAKQQILHTHYHPKIMEHILKNKRKNKCVYSWDYEDENEKRSHWYDINRPRSRHGHKYSEYKKCLNMAMLMCVKQHRINTWPSIHKKVKQHWGWVEKKRCL